VKPIETRTLGIVGLGLMGGAIAVNFREQGLIPAGAPGGGRILACDAGAGVLEPALSEGIIDEGFTDPRPMLQRCDLVFLCLSPAALLRFMDDWMASFRPGALITDIAGIKAPIAAAMEQRLRNDLDFIPGHPMAGKELRKDPAAGFAEARRCAFKGKNYILTPLKRNRPENLRYLRDLIFRMGFGRISETPAAEHDRNVAFTSQLCHIIAAALVDCEADIAITRFGGGSFEDLTRIAMLNAPLWTELFLANREELLARITQFQGSLASLKSLIAGGREAELEERLQLVRDRRSAMP
jgi:prephenate dehydrogenase